MENSLSKSGMLDASSFVPASSKDFPAGTLIIQKEYLALRKDSKCGIPGIFQIPTDEKKLCSPSYNLVTKGVSFVGHDIIRFIVTPASDITVIPCSLGAFYSEDSGFKIEKTSFLLQSSKDIRFTRMTGESTRVNLGIVLRSARDLTQRFQIDGAILIDPGIPIRLPLEGRLVCQLGMDFITKYPYLFYVPRHDPSGTVDFMIARDPFISRPYSVNEQFYKTLIVHVDGYYDKDTGKIGCGAFFGPGSVFNTLSGVSMYDKAGNKHTTNLRERGIFMAIIKTLHIVSAFPVGRDFRGVIIKSTDPSIARMMAVTQVTMKHLFVDTRRSGEDGFDPMAGGYYYPTANRDLILYFCRIFLRKELGFKITFEDSKPCGEAQAANMLAITASQMDEFSVTKKHDDLNDNILGSSTETQPREVNKAICPDIPSLSSRRLEEDPQYISLGLDGYFNIQQSKIHAIMEAADLAGMSPQEEAKDFANLALDNKQTPGLSQTVDIKVQSGNKADVPIDTELVTGDSANDRCKYGTEMMNEGLIFRKPRLGKSQEIHTNDLVLRKMEIRIRDEADARISEAKKSGKKKYLRAEEQMVIRMQHIAEERLAKQQLIDKQMDDELAATKAKFTKKREFILDETRSKIEVINAEVSRCLEILESNTGEAGKKRSMSKGMKEGTEWSRNNVSKGFRPLMVDYNTESE